LNPELKALIVSPNSSVREVMECIDRSAKGIALVLSDDNHLLATVTDGDIRRAILAGMDLNQRVHELIVSPSPDFAGSPISAAQGTDEAELLHLMNEKGIRQVPLVDEQARVVDIVMLSDLAKDLEPPLRAIVMAGGYGTRLRPLTEAIPKPMLPLGARPLLELIVEQLRDAGIKQVHVATHYKGDVIADHFKDGRDFGVDIQYLKEDQPLGTAGALGLLEESDEPLLVMNGDILTRVDFRSMLNFHNEHHADLTVAVRQYEFNVPYGVVLTDGVAITGISEKPIVKNFINAGIYLLAPSVKRFIPNGEPYDIPDLIQCLLKEGQTVVCFPIREYWLDIGKADHYDQAQADVASGRF
jgi:dTDP-glucose pyrophosphorylase/CBS domain-containing protein